LQFLSSYRIKSEPIGKPPPINVSRDDIPDDVNNKVPEEFNRVPDGKRIFDVDETFFLNVIDIVELESDVCVCMYVLVL
jgi:hypothetical protein